MLENKKPFASKKLNLTWYWIASRKWITRITNITITYRIMIYNATVSWKTTGSRTWIFTAFVDACSVCWTFWILWAFRTAIWCASNVVRQTWAYSCQSDLTTLWKWTTWIRNTFRPFWLIIQRSFYIFVSCDWNNSIYMYKREWKE